VYLFVMDGLGAVPVGIEHERAVVILTVLRTQAGLAVALVARGGRRTPRCIDSVPGRRRERDMQAPGHRPVVARLREPEAVPFVEVLAGVRDRKSERREQRLVETPTRVAVGDADG